MSERDSFSGTEGLDSIVGLKIRRNYGLTYSSPLSILGMTYSKPLCYYDSMNSLNMLLYYFTGKGYLKATR
jgi:hypothetical protein